MRRRFGRGRKRPAATPRNAPIDRARCFERIVEEQIVEVGSLEPVSLDGIPDSYAAVAVGDDGSGGPVVVAYSPHHGGDAALAALAYARSAANTEPFRGEVFAVCPQWSIAAQRRLELIAPPDFGFSAVTAPALADGEPTLELRRAERRWLPTRRVADRLEDADRELFLRALAGLEGLAAKHRGAVRGSGDSVELVLLARPVARLRAEPGSLTLDTILPDKRSDRLESEQLSAVLDRLEGGLRKRLNDRRLRAGEEGLRAGLWSSLVEIEKIRHPQLWPLSGSDPEVVDLVGVGEDATPLVACLRSRLTLPELGAILDAVATLEPVLPAMFAELAGPVRFDSERLVLGANEFEPAVLAVLPLLSLESRCYDVQPRRGRDPDLVLRESAESAVPRQATGSPDATATTGGEDRADTERPAARAAGRRPRRGRRGGSGGEARERGESGEARRAPDRGESGEGEAAAARYDEVSIFDLDEGPESDVASRRPRRGRRRSRRSRSSADASGSADEAPPPVDAPPEEKKEARSGRSRSRGRGRRRPDLPVEPEASEEGVDDAEDEELADSLIPQVSEVEEPDVDVAYLADVEVPDEDAPGETEEEQAAAGTPVRRRRRRAAIVAHADRGSLIAAVLLARDLRLLEGLWVYPQTDLMTFFRSVATDLHEETPIFVVGFTASPARDTIQAASLYAERISWFDHHDWPPEDLDRMREALGAANVRVTAGAESPIAAVLSQRTRRSRFSDKVVELATGRFTQHDYERWGRLWWQRLGDIAATPGDRRADVEPILAGRPSDLAREVAEVPVPPPPVEVEFVAGHDFRLVHFGGYRMVVVPTPPELDVHLTCRVARERHDAPLSLGFTEGDEVVILAGDESRARRSLDLLAMANHLVSKHDWIGSLPTDDYVARIRIHDLVSKPDRLGDVIGEIAMGRSILEG